MREIINPITTIWFRCSKCESSFFVKSSDEQKKLLNGKSMRCPNYIRCKGQIIKRGWTNVHEIRKYTWVSALELYQACAGLGFEAERDCSPKTINNIMQGSRIMDAEIIATTHPKKSILLSLTLEDGKTIHLASSVYGPVIYKITGIHHGRG